jgi:hypothetical protein
MTNNKSPKNLLEAINRIAFFSYEPAVEKYPFLKKYLKREIDLKAEWTLLMTAAGAGYVLLTKEDYHGEHDEIIKSIESVNGLPGIVKKFMDFMSDMYKNDEKFYHIGIGAWIMRQIKGNNILLEGKEETLKQIDEINITVVQLLNSTIEDYVRRKNKNTSK